jgi:hypothetical protein
MIDANKMIYLQNAYAHSACGNAPLDIYANIETGLIKPQAEPGLTLMGLAQQCVVPLAVPMEPVVGLQPGHRLRLTLKQFIPAMVNILPDNACETNTQVWLQVPPLNSVRSEFIHTQTLLPYLCSPKSCVSEFSLHWSLEPDALNQACEHLQERDDLQYIIFISIDSLVNDACVQERLHEEVLLTNQASQGAAVSEACVALVLSKKSQGALLQINTHSYQPDASKLVACYESLHVSEPDVMVMLHHNTRAALQATYSLEQTCFQAPFSTMPKAGAAQCVQLSQVIGDTGVSQFAMGLLYAAGCMQFPNAANDNIVLVEQGVNHAQALLVTRCL